MGICRPSKSPWASPLHVVPKKGGEIRPCGDYRQLNSITKPDRYPIPRVQDFTYILSNKKVFSRIDINRAYHCILINPEDVEKTAIITPFGLFEFTRMMFGLKNAAQTFQRFMNCTVLQGLDFLFSFVDDIILASDSMEEHREHLKILFERLDKYGLTINLSKCDFGKSTIQFLGYEVSTEGIKPLSDKIKVIQNFPKPETVDQLRRFLGMVNFYRSHLPHAAENQAILNSYLHNSKKNDKTKIVWSDKAEQAFLECKDCLQQAVTLSHPLANSTLALFADASDTSVGAALNQCVEGKWKPLGYFSKRLSDSQTKYSTYDRELLAVYLALQHFRNMVEGRELIIYTDHKPLTFAFSRKISEKETPRRTRQLLFISEFTTDIRHVCGNENVVADCLSRLETIDCPSTLDYSEISDAQRDDTFIQDKLKSSTENSQFREIFLPTCEKSIVCNMLDRRVRPYLPEKFRKIAFDMIHNISHPGIRTTRKLITNKFYWPSMNKQIGMWAKTCIKCQRSKVQRHTKSQLGTFQSGNRFEHIHVDLVGPLPTTADGYRYLVTIIDRKTGWPEAFPIQDIHAEKVAKVIYEGWIVRFGCPIRITSDQGTQFESSIFNYLMKFLGIHRIHTTSYHPQSNGMVERWHRSLKSALMARLNNSQKWLEELSTVMFGLRIVPRTDTNVSAAEMVYGTTIRVPGEFFDNTNLKNLDSHDYVKQIRDNISKFKDRNSRQCDSRKIFVHPDLNTCSQVFVRNDMVRKSLQPPYNGPYSVLRRFSKNFLIKLPNKNSYISIDRLKPAYVLNENDLIHSDLEPKISENKDKSQIANRDKLMTRTTRSGRVVKLPVRFR